MDIKYGVERLFATDVINGGPSSYFIQRIEHPAKYKGPYKSGDLEHDHDHERPRSRSPGRPERGLRLPDGDGGLVPGAVQDRGWPRLQGRHLHQAADGVRSVQDHSRTPQNKSIVLVRNPNWSQSTDAIRHPLVNEVDLNVDTDPVDIDKKLKAGTADATRRPARAG